MVTPAPAATKEALPITGRSQQWASLRYVILDALERAASLLPHLGEPDEAETGVPPQRPDFPDHLHGVLIAPHDQRVEREIAAVHPPHSARRLRESNGQDGCHLGAVEDQYRLVILGVGDDLVIEDEHEKQRERSEKADPQDLHDVLRSIPPKGVGVHAHQSV